MKINVDIADDHKMVLQGIKSILDVIDNIHVQNMYESGVALLKGLKQSAPDVLLLDIQLSDSTAEELVPVIRKSYPDIKILIMTGFDTTYYTKSMIEKGALGYLLKNTDEKMLAEAIHSVYKGLQFIDPAMQNKLVQESIFPHSNTMNKPILTKREKDILRLIMEEKTSQEIAAILFLSIRTVENQRVNLMQKLDVKNAVGLAKKTIEMNLLND